MVRINIQKSKFQAIYQARKEKFFPTEGSKIPGAMGGLPNNFYLWNVKKCL